MGYLTCGPCGSHDPDVENHRWRWVMGVMPWVPSPEELCLPHTPSTKEQLSLTQQTKTLSQINLSSPKLLCQVILYNTKVILMHESPVQVIFIHLSFLG